MHPGGGSPIRSGDGFVTPEITAPVGMGPVFWDTQRPSVPGPMATHTLNPAFAATTPRPSPASSGAQRVDRTGGGGSVVDVVEVVVVVGGSVVDVVEVLVVVVGGSVVDVVEVVVVEEVVVGAELTTEVSFGSPHLVLTD